jgi:hypothetical protein
MHIKDVDKSPTKHKKQGNDKVNDQYGAWESQKDVQNIVQKKNHTGCKNSR